MTTVGDLAVIRFAAVQPRRRDRSFKTAEQVEERGVLGEFLRSGNSSADTAAR